MPKWNSPIVGRRRVLQGTAVVSAATLVPSLAAKSQDPPKVIPVTIELTADEIRSLLKLEPNATCGFVRVTFVSKESIAAGGLPAAQKPRREQLASSRIATVRAIAMGAGTRQDRHANGRPRSMPEAETC